MSDKNSNLIVLLTGIAIDIKINTINMDEIKICPI
jgi:hypothetical protein